jgi:molybdate transport system ATP-binding protein
MAPCVADSGVFKPAIFNLQSEITMSFLECRCQLRYPSGFAVDCAFVTDAQVTALFGPSGSGKTSVLSMIAGLRRPDAGRIQLGARVLFDSDARVHVPPEERRIGYVFQDQLLFPHLKVERNLLYGWQRRPPNARSVDFHRVVQVLELADVLERLPHTLSGGQRQRVALGRALLCGPDLLLLDEPLASLDEPLKKRILDYVDEILKEWSLPTLFVTHVAEDVKRMACRVVTLSGGRVHEVEH